MIHDDLDKKKTSPWGRFSAEEMQTELHALVSVLLPIPCFQSSGEVLDVGLLFRYNVSSPLPLLSPSEKLHASPMKVNCITLATSKPSAGVVMASYPHDPSIPELSAEHPAVVGGFTRCLENTRLSSSSPGNHAPGSMLARAEAAAVKGNSSTSSLASHMSSQTPPIARASTSATKVTLPSRTVSLGRRRGQKMRSEAGTFDSNVRLMMERFNAAKVREFYIGAAGE